MDRGLVTWLPLAGSPERPHACLSLGWCLCLASLLVSCAGRPPAASPAPVAALAPPMATIAAPPSYNPSAPISLPPSSPQGVTWTIAADLADCVGLMRTQCLQYRDNPAGPWQAHHGPIEGFVFQAGVEVDIQLQRIDVQHPMADAASQRLVWVKELARRQPKDDKAQDKLPDMALPGTHWQLQSLAGSAASTELLRAIVLSFEPQRLHGFAGVNRYFASAQVVPQAQQLQQAQGTIGVGAAMSTRMGGSPQAMALERHFLKQLARSAAYQVDAAQLMLLDPAGHVLMVLTRP